MNKKLLAVVAMILLATVALSSCSVLNTVKDFFMDIFAPSVELTDEALKAEKIIDFKDGANPDVLFESDGWSNGDVFNVVWKKHNVKYENGIMTLGITEEKATAWVNDVEVEYDYTAGEARTQNYYHYGDYEVSMKPSANPGTASTFFVCTGPYDLKDGVPNAHDEIDIEFLGDDTTHVQFNFFVDGKGGNEYMYDLGFDASEKFHTYGFRWLPDSITWFVDGEPVYKVTTDSSVKTAGNLRVVEKLPSTAGRILTNYWCGNKDAWAWMGQYQGAINDNGTEYQWIATSAEGAPLNPVEPPVDGGEDIDWTAIDPIAPTFESTPEYTVVIDGNKADVTYTDVSGDAYKPIEMDVTEAVAGMNFVYLKVTNNGTETVNVRVNMFDPTLTGNNKATNISATMNGKSVFTDTAWGGSFFDIPAGETCELVVNFGVGGVKLQLMIDSSRNDTVLRSGSITVEDIKFTAVGEVEAPHTCTDDNDDAKCDICDKDLVVPPSVKDPESGNLTTTIGGTEVQLGGNVTDGYGVHGNADGTIRVEYTNISTNTYENVWAQISSVAAGKSEISLKIKNNGEATAYITVKIEAAGAVALMEGKMEIPAGEEHTYTGTFSGEADKLYFFIDSGWSTETTYHAGEVVISEIAFAGEGGGEPADTGLQPTFWTSSPDYTVNGNNIKYSGAGNAYSCVGFDVASIAAGKNTFTITITNNGSADSRVRVDIKGTTIVGNHSAINTTAVGGDVWTDMEWGGSSVTVPAGESVTLVITYDVNTDRGAPTDICLFVDAARGTADTYSSDITLSGMAFSGEVSTPDDSKGEKLSYVGNDCYTITPAGQATASVNVAYASVSTNTYQNVNAKISGATKGYDYMTLKIKNNGTETVTITVKLEDINASAIVEVKAVIPAGEEQLVTLNFGYDKSAEVDAIFFFIDTGWSETNTTHAGDVTISEVTYCYAAATGIDLNFTAEENTGYTISGTNEVNIKYEGAGNTYKPVTASVADLAAGNNAFTVTIKNNGSATARVRIDIQGTTWCATGDGTGGMGTDACNVTATGDGVWTDTMWGGSHLDLEAGAEVTVVVYYNENGPQGAVRNLLVFLDSCKGDGNAYSSDITLSVMNFSTEDIPE